MHNDNTALPTLEHADAARLAMFLTEVGLHVPAFATKSGLGIIAALEFLARPEIARYLATFHRLREATQRAVALGALRDIIETAEDPIEQRRACNTMLRALRLPAPLPEGGAGGWAPFAPQPSKNPGQAAPHHAPRSAQPRAPEPVPAHPFPPDPSPPLRHSAPDLSAPLPLAQAAQAERRSG